MKKAFVYYSDSSCTTIKTYCLTFTTMIKSCARTIFFVLILSSMCSCAVKRGCPSNGANIGAERILSGDPQAMKDLKKAKKYNIRKF